jgi:hypothetical protein
MRRRIEHDYRELRHGLGLDHFEGRAWRGRHHHVTLVIAAQAFLTLRRLDPEVRTPAWPSTRSRPPPGSAEVLDRYLHHLRTPPAQYSKKPQTARNLAKHY